MSEPPSTLRSLRLKTIQALTKLQHISPPFINAFLLVHLSAPLVANVGGSHLSSQVMLLGREYYQSAATEPLLVFGPLALHVSASLLKRVLLFRPPPINLLSLTAYPALFLLAPHVFLHRLGTANVGLDASDVDYELPKFALQKWPLRSAVLYGGLVVAALLHAGEGIALLVARYAPGGPSRALTRTKRRIVAGSIAAAVGAGILSLAFEPSWLFGPREATYTALFEQSPLYR
ncbi:hypothetical protein EXIGLDRAFT_656034 [Exidia glandulosa HHB12029]|uniref:Mitochondrial adapter protein MCP1 transmembrane domain-containing protein n=1 Tax=Exidia glandulosa HHB12029 TaxID=1314781 RepID=A0A165CZB8_EXIGL|nr:hypothetical protein EXIGLDRAFT_656034 [Exidia glandulosa HHB12029]